MKKIRKIGAFTLALVMCFALASTAFANNVSGPFSVTITNKDATEENYNSYEYTAYQLFSGVLDEETEGEGENAHTVTYLSDIQWGSMFGSTQEAADQAGAAFLEELQKDKTIGSSFKDCTTAADVAAVLAEQNNNTNLVEAFADFVAQYIESGDLTATAAGTSTAATGTGDKEGTYVYTISSLDPGYYIILNTKVPTDDNREPYESAWTDPILQVVEDVNIEAKSDLPTVKKEIVDNDQTDTTTNSGINENYTGSMTYTDDTTNEAIGQVGDYSIGTDIWFQLTGTLPSNYDSYDTYKMIFHDTESEGLTFDEKSVTVYVDNGNGTLTKVSSGYTVVTTDLDDSCTFEVQIADTKSLKDESGNVITTSSSSKIVVQYQSTLNTSAVIGNNGNPNEVYMEFSNKSYNDGTGKTQPYKVWAFTFELDVSKTNEDGVTLEGAQFVLEQQDENGGVTAYLAIYGEDNQLITNSKEIQESAKYTLAWISADEAVLETDAASGKTQNVTIFESDDNGNFSIVGLDEGTYYLEEIKAPDGYNMLDGAIKLEIEATYKIDETSGDVTCSNLTITVDTGDATNGDTKKGTVSTTVINKHGSTLPSTGGIGTTIFYVVGGVLVVGALVLLVSKRRMAKQGQ